MVMRQGDVYWLHFCGSGSEPDGRRPAVMVQHDRFNRSAINTTVVAAITSNLRLGEAPGNVRLRKGEANLPRACVVNVSQVRTVDRAVGRSRRRAEPAAHPSSHRGIGASAGL